MSNFAALIAPLSISGSRLSDGSANASGKVWFFEPGGNTTVSVYKDAAASAVVTQPVTLTSGGLLNRTDFPNGIFATQPIRLYIESSSATVVSDTIYIPATAGNVGISNDATTATTLDEWITQAQTSTGGTDFNYLIATGQTQRPIGATITELVISVKAFGAKGDNTAIDTTAIQAALNYAKAAGGGVVYLPPGTYKIDQALTLSSATGVTVRGAGMGATAISSTHATANVFTLSSCSSITFEGFNVTHSSSSTGAGFALTSTPRVRFVGVGVSGLVSTNGTYRYGVTTSSATQITFIDCRITTVNGDAASRCVLFTAASAILFLGGFYNGHSGYNWELTGACGALTAIGVTHNGSSVSFPAGLTIATGVRFSFFGGSGLFFTIASATIPYINQINSSDALSGSGTSSATGAAQTPVLYNGTEVLLVAASGGAGVVTVNAPAILPGVLSDDTNLYWDFVFKNAAGGAVTWTLNAIYVTTAAIPTTDGHTISVRFRWDRTTSELREVSRADTVT